MKYFTISELIKSDIAIRSKLWNGAPIECEENLRALVENVLDPLRESFGKPIRVNSGYRTASLNMVVGGAPQSQHLRGEASDIVPYGLSGAKMRLNNLKLAYLALDLPFDQMILEDCAYVDGYPLWIHISYSKKRQRKEILRTKEDKKGYEIVLEDDVRMEWEVAKELYKNL